MFAFDNHVSLGDLVLFMGFIGGMIVNWFTLREKVNRIDYKLEELRRGRGLMLEHWPQMVRQCFGFDRDRPAS
jgi:hypothetical protein